MKVEKIIDLYFLLEARLLSTRSAARIVADEIDRFKDNALKIYLDFRDIEMVSRSFASEILIVQREFKLKNIEIEFINTEETVQKMLTLVANAKPRVPTIDTTPQVIDLE
jgi:predicted transcriptional regulator